MSDDRFGLLGSNFCNLDLSLPVLDAVDELLALVLLFHEFRGVRHILHLSLKISLLSVNESSILNLSSSLVDGILSLILLGDFDLHLAGDHVLLSDGVLQLLLETVEDLDSFTGVKLKGQQFLVSFIDVLHMLFVLNL